ncbi:hypothetical protein ACWCPQ_16640 [Nocardia sp. NPDC001965]
MSVSGRFGSPAAVVRAGYEATGGPHDAVPWCPAADAATVPSESRLPGRTSAVSIVCSTLPNASLGANPLREASAGARIGFRGARTAFGTSGYGRAGLATGGARTHALGTLVRAAGIRLAAVRLAATSPGPYR